MPWDDSTEYVTLVERRELLLLVVGVFLLSAIAVALVVLWSLE
jgi:hypothetical protein